MLSCIGRRVIFRAEIFGGRNLSPARFWRKQLKAKLLQRAIVTLSLFIGLISQIWHANVVYGMENEALQAFKFQLKNVYFFHKILGEIFWKEAFSYTFRFFLKLSAFSVPESDAFCWN